ncbi:MAG: hypothetical protein IJC63_04795, partial [Myxococcaceae bacterium]|nr:hypothetical protein [Myxococcaceae bacterium]
RAILAAGGVSALVEARASAKRATRKSPARVSKTDAPVESGETFREAVAPVVRKRRLTSDKTSANES